MAGMGAMAGSVSSPRDPRRFAATATGARRESTAPLSSETVEADRLRPRLRTPVLGRVTSSRSEIAASELGWETLMRAALELAMNR